MSIHFFDLRKIYNFFIKKSIYLIIFIIIFFVSCIGDGRSLPKPDDGVLGDDEKFTKAYDWMKSLQLDNGLLESAEDSNFVSLYDNSLAAILFSAQGDYDKAEKIFDYFNNIIDTELKVSPGGYIQHRDKNGGITVGVSDRWLGDNTWFLIALNNYHALTSSSKYQTMAFEIETWVRTQLDTTGDGGLFGGYHANGDQIHKNIEGNIDAFNAVPGYDAFHISILNFLEVVSWESAETSLTIPDFTHKYALDLHSWGFSALSSDMPTAMLNKADRFLTTMTATVNSESVSAYCFDIDLDTVWLEGTGEMVVAFRSAGMIEDATRYILELEKMLVASSKNPELSGIPYSTNPGTHFGGTALWSGADTNPCISSSAWYLLGKLGYDPMALGAQKNIPETDKFWK